MDWHFGFRETAIIWGNACVVIACITSWHFGLSLFVVGLLLYGLYALISSETPQPPGPEQRRKEHIRQVSRVARQAEHRIDQLLADYQNDASRSRGQNRR
jgi:hypothetical protein